MEVVFLRRSKAALTSREYPTRHSGGVSDVYNQNDNPVNPYSQFSDLALSMFLRFVGR